MAKIKVINLGHFSFYKRAFMVHEPFLVSQRKRAFNHKTFSGRPM